MNSTVLWGSDTKFPLGITLPQSTLRILAPGKKNANLAIIAPEARVIFVLLGITVLIPVKQDRSARAHARKEIFARREAPKALVVPPAGGQPGEPKPVIARGCAGLAIMEHRTES
jgi:hypothetical protein